MKVYILTGEPYHDNGSILGVFADLKLALDTLRATPNPSKINEDDYKLTEWDLEENEQGREWHMTGRQVWEGGVPVRVDFTFREGPFV